MQHREAFRTDGTRQSIGPFHFRARGVLLVNRTSVDAAFFDDAGNEYDAPAHVAATYPLAIPTTRLSGGTVVAIPATDPGSLVATVLDAETILSTAQLQTISLAQTVIQYVGSNFPATAQPDGTVIAYTPYPVTHPGVVWLLRYNATSTWWEVIGFTPILVRNELARWRTAGGFGDLSDNTPTFDVGPNFTIPRQGEYLTEIGFYGVQQGIGTGAEQVLYMETTVFPVAGGGPNAFGALVVMGTPDTAAGGPNREMSVGSPNAGIATFSAGDIISCKYQQTIGFTSGMWFQNRWLKITPRRLK